MSLTGQQVGNYQIGPLIGVGGMAEVYSGQQAGGLIGRKVAIKVVLREHCQNPDVVNRLVNEARALGKISHPGVVEVYDVQQTPDGRVCIIMEFLEGKTLGTWLRERGRVPVADSLHVVIQLVDALAAAHDQGIIHRDVKPDNVFIVVNQLGEVRTKLVDFGIAKLIGDGGLVQTGAQAKLGTAAYMPPEQFRSPKDVDHRSDMYSVGCLLFEMLTAQTPFPATNMVQAMQAHAYTPAPALRALTPDAPLVLEQLLQRMMAKTPVERFSNMRELKALLQIIKDGGQPNVFAAQGSGAYPAAASGAYMAAPGSGAYMAASGSAAYPAAPGSAAYQAAPGSAAYQAASPAETSDAQTRRAEPEGRNIGLIIVAVAVIIAIGAAVAIAFT